MLFNSIITVTPSSSIAAIMLVEEPETEEEDGSSPSLLNLRWASLPLSSKTFPCLVLVDSQMIPDDPHLYVGYIQFPTVTNFWSFPQLIPRRDPGNYVSLG